MTVIYGNCLDERNWPTEQADAIICDPPFWPFKKQYSQIERSTCGKPKHLLADIPTPDKKHYAEFWDRFCDIAAAHLKPTGWLCYKADSWTAKGTFPITLEYFDYSNEVIWVKDNIGLGRYIRTRHEQIEVYFSMGGEKKFWKNKTIMDDIPHGKGTCGKAFQSVIHLSKIENPNHINQTPKELWYQFIDYMTPVNGLIIDPFAGTLSVSKACKILNRKCWSIELEDPNSKNEKKGQHSIDVMLNTIAAKAGLDSFFKTISPKEKVPN